MATQNRGATRCSICGTSTLGNGWDTCGGSFCQEAAHYLNIAKVSRRNSRKRKEAYKRYEDRQEKARRVR